MGDDSIQTTSASAMVSQINQLERRIANAEGAFDAMCLLASRPYISSELAALIQGEADELMKKDIERLRARHRKMKGTLSDP